MILLDFIVKYIPFSTIYIRQGSTTIAMISSSLKRRTKDSIKVYKLALFKRVEVDESLKFAILNSTDFDLRCDSDYIEVVLNDRDYSTESF